MGEAQKFARRAGEEGGSGDCPAQVIKKGGGGIEQSPLRASPASQQPSGWNGEAGLDRSSWPRRGRFMGSAGKLGTIQRIQPGLSPQRPEEAPPALPTPERSSCLSLSINDADGSNRSQKGHPTQAAGLAGEGPSTAWKQKARSPLSGLR